MKKSLLVFSAPLALVGVAPSALAAALATPPNQQIVTCPTFQGVVTIDRNYGGICGWFVYLEGHDGYKFDLGQGDRITFDHVEDFIGGTCMYKVYDKNTYVGMGRVTANCMSCKAIPGTNTLSCVQPNRKS